MKALYALFLILVLMSSIVFAQNPVNSKSEAKMIDEFGFINLGEFEARLDVFLVELQREPFAQSYIINYGSDKEASRNELIVKNYYSRRKADIRVSFIRGGFLEERKTQFWLIPARAQPPKVTPRIHKIDEIGRVGNRNFTDRFNKFLVRLNAEEAATAYIINYGKASEVTKRERLITDTSRCHHCRIVIVNGGESEELKTVFWLVPAGAEPPVAVKVK